MTAAVGSSSTESLRDIRRLLAVQVRMLGLSLGFECDREALADAKDDFAAVCRGHFDEVRPRYGFKRFDSAHHELGDVIGDRVPNPAVDHRDDVSSHIASPSLVTPPASVGVEGAVSADPPSAGAAPIPESRCSDAYVAGCRAVMEWVDAADGNRELIGCTPAMVAGVAINAFLAAGGAR